MTWWKSAVRICPRLPNLKTIFFPGRFCFDQDHKINSLKRSRQILDSIWTELDIKVLAMQYLPLRQGGCPQFESARDYQSKPLV